MATKELQGSEWKEFSQADYAVIDCYGDQCFACTLLAPVYDGLADELGDIAFGRINISQYPEIADAHNISAMPTLLFFRHGELVNQSIGSLGREDLLAQVAALLYQ